MRRAIGVGLGGAIAAVRSAHAEVNGPTVGLLMTGGVDSLTQAFFKGLASMGFEEGRNLTVVRRSAAGQFDKLPALAQDLAKQKVDAIVAMGGPGPTRAAKAATTTIPIVFAYGGDPVADGLVASLNQPGANVTGATFIGSALLAKRMELLRQMLPDVTEVALLVNPKGTLAERQVRDATAAAPLLGQRLHVLNTSTVDELDTAFAAMSERKIGAYIVSTDPFFGFVGQQRLLELSVRYRLPGVFNARLEAAF